MRRLYGTTAIVTGAVSYAVGPGITAGATVLYADWEGGNDIYADGVLGVIGLKYNF